MNLNVIMRVSERCNLNCRYCYISAESRLMSRRILAPELLDQIYELTLGSGRFSRVEFIWHGGEPLIVGYDYLKAAFEKQKLWPEGVLTRNSIQSNGTMVDSKMAELFQQHDVAIGISIDAPPGIHENMRTTWAGRKSLSSVLRGLKILKDAGTNPAAICVLTRRNVNRVREIYDFFSELRIPFKLNPCYPAEASPPCVEELKVSPVEYGNAICELLDLYLSDSEPSTRIADLDEVMRTFYTGCSSDCMFEGRCHEFIGISPEGDVFLCDFFYQDQYRIGNVRSLTADSLIHNPVTERIRLRQRLRPAKCRACEWWDVCRGGCPSVAFSIWGDAFREDYFCRSRIALFNKVQTRLGAAQNSSSKHRRPSTSLLGQKLIRIESEVAK